MKEQPCNQCGHGFMAFPSSHRKFCSVKCKALAQGPIYKNHPAVQAGLLKARSLIPYTTEKFRKAKSDASLKAFAEGRSVRQMGSDASSWKGDEVGYGGLHDWIRSHYGKADRCENVYCPGLSTRYEWANVSHEYKRERADFVRLCKRCHSQYDRGHTTLAQFGIER